MAIFTLIRPQHQMNCRVHHHRCRDRAGFADAVLYFAFQIAASSRPPDPRWGTSGDGSVTSLDALMILQAAAGSIRIG